MIIYSGQFYQDCAKSVGEVNFRFQYTTNIQLIVMQVALISFETNHVSLGIALKIALFLLSSTLCEFALREKKSPHNKHC